MPIGWLAGFWIMRPLGFASLGSCRLAGHAGACLALHLALLRCCRRVCRLPNAAWSNTAAAVIRWLLLLLLCYSFTTAGRSLLLCRRVIACAIFASCCLSSADAGSGYVGKYRDFFTKKFYTHDVLNEIYLQKNFIEKCKFASRI